MTVKAVSMSWGPSLESLARKMDPFCGVDAIGREISAGHMQAWQVFADETSLGCFITRIDGRYDGEKDLVLIFTVAEFQAKQSISRVMYQLLEEIARAHGIKYIRIHVDRPALSRIVEHAGFHFLETIYIKRLDHDDKK
jgi:hypothetical protein